MEEDKRVSAELEEGPKGKMAEWVVYLGWLMRWIFVEASREGQSLSCPSFARPINNGLCDLTREKPCRFFSCDK